MVGLDEVTEFKEKQFSKLSIVIPAFNESNTIATVVENVFSADVLNLSLEVVVVDDQSDDSSREILKELEQKNPRLIIERHERNLGKGASLRTGFAKCTGEIVLVQDADLEYNPKDYPILLRPILEGKADVVFGSRFRSNYETRVLYFWHRVANGFLSLCSNMFTNLNLTDMETGY